MTRKLLLVASIALVVCTGFGFEASCTAPPTAWRLTVTSTEGGSAITPGEGMFWYYNGDFVILSAVPDPGYRFVNWTGKVDTVGDFYAATTMICMMLDYTITANFAPVSEGQPMGLS
jgi:hypothetical protein